jgi:hypothetical protein
MNSTTMIMNLIYKPGPVIIAASLPGFKRKSSFTLLFCLFISFAVGQQGKNQKNIEKLGKYTGKYESNGMVVQVALKNKNLVMYVPGAPAQELIAARSGNFKTAAFSDEIFRFEEKGGKVEKMISERGGVSTPLQKISDKADDFENTDALLTHRKSTDHFKFLYSLADSSNVGCIAGFLEENYDRVLHDLRVTKIPEIVVRIYPDIASFRNGINFPNAPDFIQATAFGKNDFRIVSPNIGNLDTAMYVKGAVHEFTHCVHLNIDYAPNNPRWLWEGIAMFESGWFFDPKDIDIIKNRQFPKLAELGNGMEYMLGFVILEAIRDIWGQAAIINLIKKRGSVKDVLNLSETDFEKQVFEHIYKKYITR